MGSARFLCFGGLFVCKFSTHHSLMGFGPQRFHSELTTHARDLRHKGFASCGTCATSAINFFVLLRKGRGGWFCHRLEKRSEHTLWKDVTVRMKCNA